MGRNRRRRPVFAVLLALVGTVLVAGVEGAPAASTYATAILADQPWGYWQLDELSGTTAGDSSANGHPLMANTRTWFTEPLWGRPGPRGEGTALELRGNPNGWEPGDQVYNIVQNGADFVDNFTAELWVNPSLSSFAYQFLIGAGNPIRYASTGWGLLKNHSEELELWVNGERVLLGPPLPIGAWSYVAVTRDSGVWHVYRDGVEVAGGATQTPITPNDFYFGADAWNGGGFNFKGLIADGAFYREPLSADRILAHFQAARIPVLPRVTESSYEYSIYKARFAIRGNRAGRSGKSGPVILSLGRPDRSGQLLFGPTAAGGGLRSYNQIIESLKTFSNAYHNGWQDRRGGSITLVWGTNTTFVRAWNTDLGAAERAGAAFARAVLTFHQWLIGPHGPGIRYNRQRVIAGIDVEQDPREGWSDYPVVRAFLQGYRSVAGHRPIVNYGALTFVPECGDPACAYPTRQWTGRRVMEVSRPPLVSAACPQVYTTTQIDYWLGLQRLSGQAGYGRRTILFQCLFNSEPSPPFLTPQQSWDYLWRGIGTRERFFERNVTCTKALARSRTLEQAACSR